MAKYSYRYDELQNQADLLRGISGTLFSLERSLNLVASSIDGRDSAMASLKLQIQPVVKSINKIAEQSQTYASSLTQISGIYMEAEMKTLSGFSNIVLREK